MTTPTPTDIGNLQFWSLYKHYHNSRSTYVMLGRGLVKIARITQNSHPGSVFTEDQIARFFLLWLTSDQPFNTYLDKKPHLSPIRKSYLIDAFARYAAYEGYTDITK